MRIVIDARLYGVEHRGLGRYQAELVRHLAELDSAHEYVLLTNPINREQPHALPRNFSCVSAPWHPYSVSSELRLPALVSSLRPDVTHYTHVSVPARAPQPFVVTIHDLLLHHFPNRRASTRALPMYLLKLLAYRLTVRAAVARARSVLTPSQAVADDVAAYYPKAAAKIRVVPLAGSLPVRDEKIEHSTPPMVVMIGAAYPHKNLRVGISAVGHARSVLPDLRLVLVGRNDTFMQRLKDEVAGTAARAWVEFPGELPDADIAELLDHSACYFIPSLMEGFGLSIIDAFARRTPVVASDIPVFREVAGSAAMFANPRSPQALGSAIVKVMKGGAVRSKLLADSQLLLPKYSWRRTAEQTLQAYEEAVA